MNDVQRCISVLLIMACLNDAWQTQQHKFVNWQCDGEYRGDDFTAAVTLGNPDVLVGSGNMLCICYWPWLPSSKKMIIIFMSYTKYHAVFQL